jgi:lipopolysaccharide/colanic/teichoic acid biosynthesis glycosyltransferase
MRRASRLLLYLGTAATVLGLSKYHAAEIGHYDLTGSSRFAWAIGYIVLLALAAYGAGLPDLARGVRGASLGALGATGAAAVGISLVQLASGSAQLPRFVVFGSAGVLVVWYVGCSLLALGGRTRAEERDRVVLVGGPGEADALRTDLDRAPERHASIVAVLTPAEASAVRPKVKPLVDAVVAQRATVVVLSREAQIDDRIVAQAASLHEAGVRVRTLSLFYEHWLGKLPLAELERVSLMFDIGELHRARYTRVKRLLDTVLAAAGAVVLALVTPFVLAGNLLANRGPLLYRQARAGKNGRTFEILKFRTMRAGDDGGEWTSVRDPRITPFGGFLRRSHLDELPQVVNILRGDLSFVGPRPEQPRYVAELADKIPFYGLRHLVRPGLTGWAQVKYGYAGSDLDSLEKLQYEFYYLRHQGLALDLRIVGRTVRSVLGARGR